jgi:hypothetical protein
MHVLWTKGSLPGVVLRPRREVRNDTVCFNLTARTEVDNDYVLEFVKLLILCDQILDVVKVSISPAKFHLPQDLCF